ncbi:MAG: hypothetical protein ACREUI_06280 [Burkholderiales bacterium]
MRLLEQTPVLIPAGMALIASLALWVHANSAQSQRPQGVALLFGFSLFISLGFLLFGNQRYEVMTP